jgi:hypothetical protein
MARRTFSALRRGRLGTELAALGGSHGGGALLLGGGSWERERENRARERGKQGGFVALLNGSRGGRLGLWKRRAGGGIGSHWEPPGTCSTKKTNDLSQIAPWPLGFS